ncbi:hypothetical protein AV521_18670 [Streptomyces sp. IMTB 2501]|nr:hypothetical protein AV521_18670 [Streptomyces sp. IMTB 2501]
MRAHGRSPRSRSHFKHHSLPGHGRPRNDLQGSLAGNGIAATGHGFWCNTRAENPAWKSVTVCLGDDVPFWTEFLRAATSTH